MTWNFEEALTYYKGQGAPGDQSALLGLLREVQQENGGGIPMWAVEQMAQAYQVKESYVTAVIKRIPSLRLDDSHCLQMCAGPNCGKHTHLADFVEKTYGTKPTKFTLKYVGCMRMCAKGPNIKWDGKVYHQADEKLIRDLVEGKMV